MTKLERLDLSFMHRRFPGQNQLTLLVRSDAVTRWCLGLVLLARGLIDSYVVADQSRSHSLKIEVDRNMPEQTRATGLLDESKSQIKVSSEELEYWLTFFMGLYRDGVATVNHIDVDLLSSDTIRSTLTLEVLEVAEPVSEIEAKRRLGLDT